MSGTTHGSLGIRGEARPLDRDRKRKILNLLVNVIDMTPGERAQHLQEFCGNDRALMDHVEELLAMEPALGQFMSRPAASFGREVEEPNLGRLVGPYRLVRCLGRGGMGSVYLAERADGQFEQKVAVKLIKRGMDTDAILHRFRSERQILASITHENIARLYDGGTTDDGLPYLVMEYVEGEPIDHYCDSRRLTVTERLRLFHGVCRAVQAAHQNLIVHRDLKPANILITTDDRPKLLDFGIAKLLAPEVGGDAPTILSRLALTPGYASPEQLRGEPITTASDVYSLGVLLYQLLTGSRPFDLPTSRPAVWERAIAAAEPTKPSTAVRRPREVQFTGGDTHTLTPQAVAAVRDGDPRKLRRRLAGDLDTIVLTALASDQERRYASAEQLAEDIRRHLEGLPVRARTPTASYRVARFVRRHSWALGAVVAFVTLLVTFAGVLVHDRHQTQLRIDTLQSGADRPSSSSIDPEIPKDQWLVGDVQDILREAVTQHHNTTGRNQLLLAENLHDVGLSLLSASQYQEAEFVLREALAIRRRELGDKHPDVVATAITLARVLRELGDLEEAYLLLAQALTSSRETLGPSNPQLATVLNNLAIVLDELGKSSEASSFYLENIDVRRKLYGARDPRVAIALNNLGLFLQTQGDVRKAEEYYRQSLAIFLSANGKNDLQSTFVRRNLASLLASQQEFDACVAEAREALRVLRLKYPRTHRSVFMAEADLERCRPKASPE